MKNIKIFTSLFLFSLLSAFVSAQVNVPNMVFTETSFDYGKIKEDGGAVNHKFLFTNTGAEPIIITQVKASCGCTTPDWSKDPVAPGAQGFVSAVYNPQGRPGAFNKSITVTSNAQNSPITLYITGDVLNKELSIEEIYRFPMDEIRLKANNANFGKLFSDEKKEQEIEFINTSDKAVSVSFDKRKTPVYVSIKSVPETVPAGEVGKIVISYDASKVGEWDYVNARVGLSINNSNNPNNMLSISSTIAEKFTDTQIKNPPVMEFIGSPEFEFGTVKQGDVIEHIFKFKNTGKSDLAIRKIGSSCGCTVAEPKNRVIKPGEESELKVVFNTAGKSGNQTKIITLIVNEPGSVNNQENSRKLIKMTGIVNVEQTNK
jgi:hypothetical protein